MHTVHYQVNLTSGSHGISHLLDKLGGKGTYNVKSQYFLAFSIPMALADGWLVLCPAHDDHDPSFDRNPEGMYGGFRVKHGMTYSMAITRALD